MIRVITYGTFDLLHYGHIRLLERAKSLGDYLIVGVTSDDFDMSRGKINVQQPLMERVEAVRALHIADEIIIEEYEGQKIDDIRRYDIDIFTVGSDWKGQFDYISEYCRVVYLDRTEGVSSTQIRSSLQPLQIGFLGDFETNILRKYYQETRFVNGIEPAGICTDDPDGCREFARPEVLLTRDPEHLLDSCDAVYIVSRPEKHYDQIKKAILRGKHVLCESPIALSRQQCSELFALARERGVVLMEAIKTAYATAYYRMLLLAKGGKIGKIISVDAACTSLRDLDREKLSHSWNSICAWGPTALLPVFQLLGTKYSRIHFASYYLDRKHSFDGFTKIDLEYPGAVAGVRVGRGVKTEGELVISGTRGYIYVPAPWWKTDYFEVRFEHQEDNRRYFYQLDGEGIRYALLAFVRSVGSGKEYSYIDHDVSESIAGSIEAFYRRDSLAELT